MAAASKKKKPSKPAPPAPPKIPLEEQILEADYKNLVKKVAAGKTLTAAERALVQAKKSQQSSRPLADPDDVPPYAKSKVELARILGITRPTLDKWFALPNHPKADAAGRHDVAAWIRWRDEHGLKGSETPSELAAKEENWTLKNEKLRLENAILKNEHTPNTVFIEAVTTFGAGLNALLMQKECELPALLAGKDIPSIRETLRKVFDEMRARMQDLAAKWTI